MTWIKIPSFQPLKDIAHVCGLYTNMYGKYPAYVFGCSWVVLRYEETPFIVLSGTKDYETMVLKNS